MRQRFSSTYSKTNLSHALVCQPDEEVPNVQNALRRLNIDRSSDDVSCEMSPGYGEDLTHMFWQRDFCRDLRAAKIQQVFKSTGNELLSTEFPFKTYKVPKNEAGLKSIKSRTIGLLPKGICRLKLEFEAAEVYWSSRHEQNDPIQEKEIEFRKRCFGYP